LSEGALLKLDLPPGLSRRSTIYQTAGRWYDANLIRWYQGDMGPIGGWTKRTTSAVTGLPRALITWRDNSAGRYIAIGTESHLYALTPSLAVPANITPSGFTSGNASASTAGGYGLGLYGKGFYGTPRLDVMNTITDASQWTLDVFGQYLVGCMAEDGKLYEWQLNTGTPAAVITNAPTSCVGLVVTAEGFIFALGAGGDKRNVAWCDQQAETAWSPSSTNQAGSYIIQSHGRLMCGKRVRGVTLVFTDLDVHAATYIGLPYVYGFQLVSENCGAISRNCVVASDSRAMWMSKSGFFAFDGASVVQVPCEIYDAVFGDINLMQSSKVAGVLNSTFSEATWYYPSSETNENDSYVTYNYLEDHWTLGKLTRLSGWDCGVFSNPVLAGVDGYVYDHENGADYTGAAMPYAESGPVELGQGDRIARVRRIITDEAESGGWSISFLVRNWNDGAEISYGPYAPNNPTPVRFSARQTRLRIDSSGAYPTPKWGLPRLEVHAGSKR
jgi:hypothetical protein